MSGLMWARSEEPRHWGEMTHACTAGPPRVVAVAPKEPPDVTELEKLRRPCSLASPSPHPTLRNMICFCILENESNALDHTKYFFI